MNNSPMQGDVSDTPPPPPSPPLDLCVLHALAVLVGGTCAGGGVAHLLGGPTSVTGHVKPMYRIDHHLS